VLLVGLSPFTSVPRRRAKPAGETILFLIQPVVEGVLAVEDRITVGEASRAHRCSIPQGDHRGA